MDVNEYISSGAIEACVMGLADEQDWKELDQMAKLYPEVRAYREKLEKEQEAVKTVSDLFLPLAGKVLEVNPLLNSNPELVNTDPYGNGWMIKVELTDTAGFNNLMSADAYSETVS